jgi:polysaccharide export outer membrane protein
MNKLGKLIPLFYFLFSCSLVFAQPEINLPKDEDYRLGGKDVLKIMVYGEPDLERTVRVSRDGSITFPLIGEVKVGGLTAAQVEEKLEQLLGRDYLVNPQVSVFIEEFHSKEIYILGAVNNPGAYPLTGKANLLEMISRAGGIDTTKGVKIGKNLILIRSNRNETGSDNSSEETDSITIDLEKLLKEGDPSLNVLLHNGDIIYVPKAETFFVFGEVKKPGSYPLEKETTVVEAITMAGGFTDIAAPNRTRIIRSEGSKETTIRVNVKNITKGGDKSKDIYLKPGDIIVVPESFF